MTTDLELYLLMTVSMTRSARCRCWLLDGLFDARGYSFFSPTVSSFLLLLFEEEGVVWVVWGKKTDQMHLFFWQFQGIA